MNYATHAELEAVRKECRSMVMSRAIASGSASLIPIPGTDAAVDVGILMNLLPAINKKFGLSQDDIEGMDAETKAAFYGLALSIGSAVIGKMVTREIVIKLLQKVGIRVATKQVTKFVPLAGQALSSLLSVSAMRYIGNKHVEDCYSVAVQLLEKRRLQENEVPNDSEIRNRMETAAPIHHLIHNQENAETIPKE